MSRKDKILNALTVQEAEEGKTKSTANIRKLLEVCTDGYVFQALVNVNFIGTYPNAKKRYYANGVFDALINKDWEV